jgi:hypothetical protein
MICSTETVIYVIGFGERFLEVRNKKGITIRYKNFGRAMESENDVAEMAGEIV